MQQRLNSKGKGSTRKRCLLMVSLVAVLALSACKGETEPAEMSSNSDPGPAGPLQAVLQSKVTLGEGEQGRVWFEACRGEGGWKSGLPFPDPLPETACADSVGGFKPITDPLAFGPAPKQGGPFGPFDFKRKVNVFCSHRDWNGRCVFFQFAYRLCGDLNVNGQRTGKVCWDKDGKAEGAAATGGEHYDSFYGIPEGHDG